MEDERNREESSYSVSTNPTRPNVTGKYCFIGLRKKRRILIVASKEIGIEINADKAKYTDMCRNQNTGGSHIVKTDNSFFEKVEEFKFLWTN